MSDKIQKFITEEKVLKNILTVKIKLPFRVFARDPKIIISDYDVLSYVQKKYTILEKRNSNHISNNQKDSRFKEDHTAEWQYKIKPMRQKPPPPTPKPKQKTCNQASFRGRLSKLAKKV